MSNRPAADAKQLTVIEVNITHGNGHRFHKHPDQGEDIYCVSGRVEQWLEGEKQIFSPAIPYSLPPTSYMPLLISAQRTQNCSPSSVPV
jgi:hypothetical protein